MAASNDNIYYGRTHGIDTIGVVYEPIASAPGQFHMTLVYTSATGVQYARAAPTARGSGSGDPATALLNVSIAAIAEQIGLPTPYQTLRGRRRHRVRREVWNGK